MRDRDPRLGVGFHECLDILSGVGVGRVVSTSALKSAMNNATLTAQRTQSGGRGKAVTHAWDRPSHDPETDPIYDEG